MIDASNIKLHISQDRMNASVTINYPEPGRFVERGDILSALAKRNVSYGIKDSEIDRIVDERIYDIDVLIAQGDPVEHGVDGYIEFLFDLNEDVAPKVLSDGRVDYYDMNIVRPVYKGEALCKMHRPTEGKDGCTVLGNALAARKGKPVQLPRGRNTQPNDEGDALIATIDGQIKKNANNIDIIQEFEVKKDVDFSTGNIQFPGSVTVRGNVLSGFTIQSGGDVTIFGLVERANITAFGNITLHGGMTGQGSGTLRAGGDIFAKYVENCHLTASGKITAECIMHSGVRAGIGIELIGKRGLLVGGGAKAREYIKAVTIGSQFAAHTEVEVGSDPKLNDRLKDIKEEIVQIESDHIKTEHALKIFKNLELSGVKLPPQKALAYDRTVKMYAEQTEKLSALRIEHDNVENAVRRNVNGYVRVSSFIYSGVKVSIANYSMMINEDLQYCTLKSDGDGIRIQPY